MPEVDQLQVAEAAPGRVLIIDDVADNRAILGRRFERRGFETAEADSGAGALASIESAAFDVVLLDVMMPDMDGLEVLRRIREAHSAAELPVIMVTGKTASDDVVKALTLGANDYITKPVDFSVALARVSTQVSRRRAEAEAREAREALSKANADLERRIAERTAELVAMNAQLRSAIAEAEAANRSKDDFLSIMSHELRTPLNGLIGMGDLLARTALDERQQKMVEIVNGSAGALHGVVTDLLDMLDINAGQLRADIRPTPLPALLEEASAAARSKAAGKGLSFQVSNAAGETIAADAPRLKQVLGKLLDNAVKFTDAGEVSLGVSLAGREAIFEIRDTGSGFDPAMAEELFKPFEQVDGSLTRRHGGLGLGLAISRGLVELMGGAVMAEGRPGVGSTFVVRLPQP